MSVGISDARCSLLNGSEISQEIKACVPSDVTRLKTGPKGKDGSRIQCSGNAKLILASLKNKRGGVRGPSEKAPGASSQLQARTVADTGMPAHLLRAAG